MGLIIPLKKDLDDCDFVFMDTSKEELRSLIERARFVNSASFREQIPDLQAVAIAPPERLLAIDYDDVLSAIKTEIHKATDDAIDIGENPIVDVHVQRVTRLYCQVHDHDEPWLDEDLHDLFCDIADSHSRVPVNHSCLITVGQSVLWELYDDEYYAITEHLSLDELEKILSRRTKGA